jgi:MFS family permease
MQADLHASLTSLQWTLNSYGISLAAGIITAAALGDRFGRRLIFTIGLALFAIASGTCALAPNTAELIAARTVQGLGGAPGLVSIRHLIQAIHRPAPRPGPVIVGRNGHQQRACPAMSVWAMLRNDFLVVTRPRS